MRLNRTLYIAAFAGVMLYGGIYLMASRSDAFKFAEHTIKNSRSLETQIGKIESVRIPLFSSYKEKFFNEDVSTMMTVKVTGVAKTAELKLRMKKTNGQWMIEQTSLDGSSIMLN